MDKEYQSQNLMGPNVISLLRELMDSLELNNPKRILDLGCGTGLSSMFLADSYAAEIFAMDLWISAKDNYARFLEQGYDSSIIPIHADATDSPFADEYFDAVFSVDSYHYYGLDEDFMDAHLAPLVKKGGIIAIAVPGMKRELDHLPDEMAVSWTEEDIKTIRSTDHWKSVLQKSKMTEIISISEMNCYEDAWRDWLETDNPYAVSDRRAMDAGAGKYMNLLSIICKRV